MHTNRPHTGRATPPSWKADFLAELEQTAHQGRWGRALMVVGWTHLALFLACQAIYHPAVNRDPRHLWLWIADLVVALTVFRVVAGPGWFRASDAGRTVVRVWGTFFILTFNLVSYNELTGWDVHWYRLAWATLSTFGFATMAWLIDLKFLIPAVQMYATGMLMVRFPQWTYVIYGGSWCLTLQALGLWLERRRVVATEPPALPAREAALRTPVRLEA